MGICIPTPNSNTFVTQTRLFSTYLMNGLHVQFLHFLSKSNKYSQSFNEKLSSSSTSYTIQYNYLTFRPMLLKQEAQWIITAIHPSTYTIAVFFSAGTGQTASL